MSNDFTAMMSPTDRARFEREYLQAQSDRERADALAALDAFVARSERLAASGTHRAAGGRAA